MVCFISFLNWKITAVQYCVGFCRTTVWIECHVFQIQHCFKDLEVESSPLPDETRIALHLLSDGYLIYILNQYFINMLWVWLALPSELLPHDLVTGGIPHAGSRHILNQYFGAPVCCGQKNLSSGHPIAFHCIQRKACKMACKIQPDLASVLPSHWPHHPGLPVSCVPIPVFPGTTQTLLPTSHPPNRDPLSCTFGEGEVGSKSPKLISTCFS